VFLKTTELYLLDLEVVKSSASSPGNGVHPLVSAMKDCFSFLTEGYIKQRFRAAADLSKNYLSVNDGVHDGISKVTHKIWLTDEKEPSLPEERFIQMYEDFLSPFSEDWLHFFWTNSIYVAYEFERRFSRQRVQVKVISSCEHVESFEVYGKVSQLIKKRKYAFACDLLRIEVLYRFGGLYSDIGIKFLGSPEDLLSKYPYVFILGDGLFLQNSLMGVRQFDPIMRKMIDISLNPHVVPRALIKEITPISEAWISAGPMITMIFLLSVPDQTPICLLKGNQNLLKWSSQKSWYKKEADGVGKYGSTIVGESQLDILSEDLWLSFSPANLYG